jgi:hypothetical protein
VCTFFIEGLATRDVIKKRTRLSFLGGCGVDLMNFAFVLALLGVANDDVVILLLKRLPRDLRATV